MNSLFYPKLSATNIKKNAKTYIPYMLSCIGSIMMYYMMITLSKSSGLDKIYGGAQMKEILKLGGYVIAIFSVIFLFYTNSFLIKRRKKEFGLFNILGMEKKHISKMMLLETLDVAIITLVTGILGGIVFSKLMQLVLLKIMHLDVQFGFEVSLPAICSTLILFGVIFFLSFLNTLRQIHLAKPIDLLKGGQTGEKEPKTRWLLTLFGLACLGGGYYIALTTESPLMALMMFFLAVILVIAGTYSLFISGTIAVLKLLRKNKKYYYQTKHFTSISGMIYRMRQNAVGLANICILSTAVLVVLSTTFCLYIGIDDVLRTRYPRNVAVNATNISEEQAALIDTIIQEESDKLNISPKNTIRFRSQYFALIQNGNVFTGEEESSTEDAMNYDKVGVLIMIPLSEYNQMMNQTKTLAKDEVLLYRVYGDVEKDTINVCGHELKIKERLTDLNIDGKMGALVRKSYYLIVPDVNTIETLYKAGRSSNEAEDMKELSYYCGLDVEGSSETQISLSQAISQRLSSVEWDAYSECAAANRNDFYSIYGGLFFIGIFIGALFIMATVLIIYYKQISEGYDDKERFEIMQKVGMSHQVVRKSIHSQVLTVFFLPLIAAVIHIAFAFKVITKLLSVLMLTNIPLFALCTVGTILAFALFYAVVYALTAKVYYKIVS